MVVEKWMGRYCCWEYHLDWDLVVAGVVVDVVVGVVVEVVVVVYTLVQGAVARLGIVERIPHTRVEMRMVCGNSWDVSDVE